ncbi:MAG: hypothetical protein HOE92_06850 [Euryarchaeota archaeon]|jgi:dihydrofolate synthase/folylpolyglutamate synthase|nr:hypothetical protein [Euryarchaeota archaeon]MBT6644439.1 hypothetical protein [Euryarchaeota archaeon]
MSSNETEKWLNKCRNQGMSLGLERTNNMLDRLGNPELLIPAIHVAGSNGKGTACALISGALILSGKKVGTFTSPHIVSMEERIRINGQITNENSFRKAVEIVELAAEGKQFAWQESQEGRKIIEMNESELLESLQPTFFEATYLIAMLIFAEREVDVAVLETGLGGRLDATNTCHPIACLITSLSLEHSEILGDTIEKIAIEKAGIAKQSCPLVLRNSSAEVEEAIKQIIPSPELLKIAIIPPQLNYREEAKLLVNKVLLETKFASAVDYLEEANEKVRWPARMQNINQKVGVFTVEVILDAAHNPSGINKMLPEFANKTDGRSWALFIGSSPQGDIESFLNPFVNLCQDIGPPILVVVSEPQAGRHPPISHEILAEELRDYLPPGIPITGSQKPIDAWKAFVSALAAAGGQEVVLGLSTGSLYLQGNILKIIGQTTNKDLALLP